MTFNPVSSSMIASVGYDPTLEILGVRFHGGNAVVHGNVSRDDYVGFMAASSKGKHYNAFIASKPKISASKIIDSPAGAQNAAPPAGAHIELKEPLPLTPLETFAGDDCCSRRLQVAKREGLNNWQCPRCGSAWKRQQLPNGMSHWAPETAFFVVPAGRA